MVDFQAVLKDATQLSEVERLQLIDALWESVPAEAEIQLHEDWAQELERRVASIKAGTTVTTPWETVRANLLARIGQK